MRMQWVNSSCACNSIQHDIFDQLRVKSMRYLAEKQLRDRIQFNSTAPSILGTSVRLFSLALAKLDWTSTLDARYLEALHLHLPSFHPLHHLQFLPSCSTTRQQQTWTLIPHADHKIRTLRFHQHLRSLVRVGRSCHFLKKSVTLCTTHFRPCDALSRRTCFTKASTAWYLRSSCARRYFIA